MANMKKLNGSQGGLRGDVHVATLSNEFADALRVGRLAFTDVFDLLHIQAERPNGRGNHTRATLNPLILMLAVSAWERQWKSLLAYHLETEPANSPPRLMEYSKRGHVVGKTAPILNELTDGTLPRGFQVNDYRHVVGKRLQTPETLSGADFDPNGVQSSPRYFALAHRLNRHIELRNGVAHRVVGEKMEAVFTHSDAASGNTINTSVARGTAAFILQLVDQTVEALLQTPPPGVHLTSEDREAIRLPRHWLSDQGGGRGARRFEKNELWGGVDLRVL